MSAREEIYDLPPEAMAVAVQEALFRRYGQLVRARGWRQRFDPCVDLSGRVAYASCPELPYDRRDGAFVLEGHKRLHGARHVEIESLEGQGAYRFAFAERGAIGDLAPTIEAHWDGLDKRLRRPVVDVVVETPQGKLVPFITTAPCVLHAREAVHALRYQTGALVTASDLCLHLSYLGERAAIVLYDDPVEVDA